MTNHIGGFLRGRRSLFASCRFLWGRWWLFAICHFLLAAAIACAQTRPSFEVASIKPINPEDRRLSFNIQPGGRLILKTTLNKLIGFAYDLKPFQIVGGPAWMGSDLFEITAKAEESAKPDQINLMLQSLLAERFHLVVRRETKEMPIYALTLAKNGPKFTQAKDTDAPVVDFKLPEGAPRRPAITMVRRGRVTGQGIDIERFINVLSSFVGRAVLDKTGLKGTYDLKVEWQPDENQVAMFQAMGVPEGFGAPPPDPLGPTLFTALQEQLGLRLESQKGPVEMLVIERVEKPSEN